MRASRTRDGAAGDGAARKFDQLASKIDTENTLSAPDLQARRVAERFGLPPSTASAVAALVWEVAPCR